MKYNERERELEILSGYFSGSMLKTAAARLDGGEPLAYITGEQYFYNIKFKVTPAVLIPRPDTERVVDRALALLADGAYFADLCTGSGCIAETILYNRRDTSAVAVDISAEALNVAKENAYLWSVGDRLTLKHADVFDGNALGARLFDAIISNPPYIKTGVLGEYPSLAFEPRKALDGGEDGMIFYRAIVSGYMKNLKPDGLFIFEIGYDQADDMRALCRENGLSCDIYRDYGGNDRVCVAKRANL